MNDIINKSFYYVSNILINNLTSNHKYHNLNHTLEVFEFTKILCDENKLNEEETEIVLLAALFHDAGFIHSYNEHEEKSKEIAKNFLIQENYPSDKIEKVRQCIDKTKLNEKPENILEMILCDADLIHIARNDYGYKTELLREEKFLLKNEKYSDLEWAELNLNFLTKHMFYTNYVLKNFVEIKEKNISNLKKKIKKLKKKDTETQKIEVADENKKEELLSSRSIDGMFRIMARNHIELSAIADNKANILISINALIISILITFIGRSINEVSFYTLPIMVLVVINMLTIIFATLSTRPKVTSEIISLEDLKKKKSNLLFFGNFYRLKFEDYEKGLREVMKNTDYIYAS
jgi:predicted metal-dependent HD superfamily phosphohydrolase